uniref:Uncharacterized protein n=1 Tax=Lepeophtheirus salmonis TaxID=72036 RepID=A0A0K2TS74_LEPSM
MVRLHTTSKKAQMWLEDNLPFCSKKTSHKYQQPKDTVNQHRNAMSVDYILNGCIAFRSPLEAVIDAKGGYIDN